VFWVVSFVLPNGRAEGAALASWYSRRCSFGSVGVSGIEKWKSRDCAGVATENARSHGESVALPAERRRGSVAGLHTGPAESCYGSRSLRTQMGEANAAKTRVISEQAGRRESPAGYQKINRVR